MVGTTEQRPLVGGGLVPWVLLFHHQRRLDCVLGVETPLLRFGYSYDITISDLTPATGGAHEIHLGMKFACPQRSKFRTISCPTF